MPDRIEDTESLKDIVGVGLMKVNDGPYVIDRFISFKDTDHQNPYNDPIVLKLEDIFCYTMAFRKPYDKDSRKSLKNYRNRLRNHCKTCYRLPNKCEDKGDGCRVLYLKEAMTREIKGIIVKVTAGKGFRVVV